MKKIYETPEAEKITFNYRDQVVAASSGNENGGGNGLVENSVGIGSFFCGSGGIVDFLFDYAGLGMCD